MARKKQLPSYPVGTRVHVKWPMADLDCPGVVLAEPVGDDFALWLIDVGDAIDDGEPVAVSHHDIVGTLPEDDSPEAVVAWLHPRR